MSSQLIKKDMFEVHKPSGQISAKVTKNGSLHQLTPMQFDSINFMCYKSREYMHRKYNGEEGIREELAKCETDNDAFNFLSNQEFEMDVNELIAFTGNYKHNNGSKVYSALRELKEITIEMGMFKQHDLSVEHSFSLVRRYSKVKNSSKIKYRLEPEIMYGWLFTTKPFSKMYLKIQTKLRNTYTKILYENLKDYENQGIVEKPLKLWNYIMGFDTEVTKAASNVSTLKRDYLNRSIKEINENTDIFIDDIKGKKVDGEQFMTIIFHKQGNTLIGYKDDTSDESVREKLIVSLMWAEVERRFEKSKEMGIDIKNPDSYRQTIYEKLSRDTIENQLLIKEFIEQFDETELKQYMKDFSAWYTQKIGDLNVWLTLTEDYTLMDVMAQASITKNPKDTIDLMKEFNAIEFADEEYTDSY